MTPQTDGLQKRVNELWKQAVVQLGEVKEIVTRSTGRFEVDLQKLRAERDKLLRKLSEQSYRLTDQDKVPVPAIVRRTVDRLNTVIDSIVTPETQGSAAAEATESSAAPVQEAESASPVEAQSQETSAAEAASSKNGSKAAPKKPAARRAKKPVRRSTAAD